MSYEVANVFFDVDANTSNYDSAMDHAGSRAMSFSKVFKGVALAGGAALAGAAVGAVAFAKSSVDAAAASERVAAQTDAVIKSTGGAAGRSAEQIGDLATKLSNLTGIDDEVVQGAENIVATFTNIKGTQFDETTKAALDMSTALGTDASAAAMQLSKALNDPIAGVGKLTKSGVTFSDQQKEQIKNYVALGDTAAAQQIILNEVNKEFGGSAEAAGATFEGSINKIQNAFGNLQETIGGALLPVMTKFTQAGATALQGLADNPSFQALISRVSQVAATFGTWLGGLAGQIGKIDFSKLFNGFSQASPVLGILKALLPIFPAIGSAVVAVAPAIAKLAAALGTALGQVIIALMPTIQELAGVLVALAPTIATVIGVVANLVTGFIDMLAPVGGLGPVLVALGVAFAGMKVLSVVNGLMAAFRAATVAQTAVQWALNSALLANPIGLIVVAISALVTGLIYFFTQTKLGKEIWANVMGFFQTSIQNLVAFWNTVWPAVASFFTTVWQGISDFFTTIWNGIVTFVQSQIALVQTIITTVITAIQTTWNAIWTGISAVANAIWSGIVSFVTSYINSVRSVISGAISYISGLWNAGWNVIRGVVSSVWGAISGVVSGGANAIRNFVTGAMSAISGAWSAAWNGARNLLSAAWSAIVSAVSAGISNVMGFISGLQGRVQGALSGAGQWLMSAGRNIIEGLIGGIRGAVGAVADAARSVAKSAIDAAKGALGIHSPSRVFRQIGKYVGQGLEQGIKGSAKGVQKAMNSLVDSTLGAYDTRKINVKQANGILRATNVANAALQRVANAQGSIVAKLKDAQKALKDLTKARLDYASKVTSKALDQADISDSMTAKGYLLKLQQTVTNTKKFASVLNALKKAGLNGTSYDQLVQGGVGSLGVAQSLLDSGKNGISQVNKLTGQLGSAAKALGNTAAGNMYDAGVNAAKGLVKGLQSQQTALNRQMQKVADTMVRSIKKALGIHSPSRVMRDQVGSMIPAGVASGIENGSGLVDAAMQKLVDVKKASVAAEVSGSTVPSVGVPTVGAGKPQGAVYITNTFNIDPANWSDVQSMLDLMRGIKTTSRQGRGGALS